MCVNHPFSLSFPAKNHFRDKFIAVGVKEVESEEVKCNFYCFPRVLASKSQSVSVQRPLGAFLSLVVEKWLILEFNWTEVKHGFHLTLSAFSGKSACFHVISLQ